MRIASKYKLLKGAAIAVTCGAVVYGCSDFLTKAATPEGSLDQGTLSTRSGVEGSLIATYRQLDCTGNDGIWGCAVSNWAFGSVPSDDAYTGSTFNDQHGRPEPLSRSLDTASCGPAANFRISRTSA